MYAVEVDEGDTLCLSPFQKAWLLHAGATEAELDSLPYGLLENLYHEVIHYGPNGETSARFIDGIQNISSFAAVNFLKDMMDAMKIKAFYPSFQVFQENWNEGLDDGLHHLQTVFVETVESIYSALRPGLYGIRFVRSKELPIHGALLLTCWGLVGNGILPPDDVFERVRPDVETFMLPWLAKLDELQVKA